MRDGIKEKDIQDFEKCANKLAKICERIQKYNEGAYIYANMDSLELRGNYQSVDKKDAYVASIFIPKMDCGEV